MQYQGVRTPVHQVAPRRHSLHKMVVARHLRPALFALATLSFLAQVEATSTTFSSCVTTCIGLEGCGTDDVKCMCKGAKAHLLEHVPVCMYNNCPDQIRTFDASLVTPLVSECQAIKKPIPQDKIDDADAAAEVFADKLPPLTTSKTLTTSTTSAKATPKTTVVVTSSQTSKKSSTSTTKAQSTKTETENSTTSSADDEPTSTSETTADHTPSTTLAVATTSPTQAAAQSSTSTRSAARADPTDSSPFASPRNAAGRSMASWVWASLPLALAVMMR